MSQAQSSQPANGVEGTEGQTAPEEKKAVEGTESQTAPEEKKAVEEVPSVTQSALDHRLAHITVDQIQDVNKMIDYAVRRGLELQPDVLQDIAVAKTQLTAGQVSAEVSSRFIAASAKLARAISPATLSSISFSREQHQNRKNSPRRIARKFNQLGIVVFFVLLGVQGYWFVLNGFVEDVKKTRILIKPYAMIGELSWQELNDEHASAPKDPAVTTNISTEEFHPSGDATRARLISKLVEIEKKRTASLVTSGNTTTDGSKDLKTAAALDLSGLSISDMFLLKNTLDSDSRFVGALMLYLSTADDDQIEYTHYYKAFDVSYVDLRNLEKAEYILQIISRFLLPVIYGFMGATVFLVRKIYYEYNRETLSESSTVDFRLRFFLGGVAGLAVAWFLAPANEPIAAALPTSTIANLSPLVMSFIAGYAVELLFSVLDRVVSSLTDSGVRPP
jgi:hypothetical protein